MKYFIGIDNGVSAGLSVIDDKGALMDFRKIPTKKTGEGNNIDLLELDRLTSCFWNPEFDSITIALEYGPINRLFGCKGNFRNGYYMGIVEGFLITKGYSYRLVNPKSWQEVIFKDMRGYTKGKKNDTKSLSLEAVRRAYPKSGVTDHNISDAICLAMYARSIG
jgi:hypothetical protein